MELKINENKDIQTFNYIKQIANENGYEIVSSFMHESSYDDSLSYSLYEKSSFISKMFFKKPIFHFTYSDGTMNVFDFKQSNFSVIITLVQNLFGNINNLTIKLDKDFYY